MGGHSSVDGYFKMYLIIFCPVACLGFIVISYEIAKIVVGSVFFHDCSIEDLIPIYLIVSGILPVFLGGFVKKDKDGRQTWKMCALFGFLLNFNWLICGCVWVFPNFGKLTAVDFKQCTGNVTSDCLDVVCNKHVIKFAFATLVIDWFFFSICACFVAFVISDIIRNR